MAIDGLNAVPTKRIGIVMPAYNEQDALPLVLYELGSTLCERLVVVDNGSEDATAEIAGGMGARVVHEPERGYGAACLKGIEYFRTRPVDILVFMDADGADDPDDLARVVTPIVRGEADMVVGSRVLGARERGALTPQARFGNALATTLLRRFFGVVYTDLGPFRAIRFECPLALGMEDRNFGWTVEMQVKAARAGLAAVEVPVRYRRRVAGRSKISRTLSGTVSAGTKILWTIFKSLDRPSFCP